jgi:hypothetical protein
MLDTLKLSLVDYEFADDAEFEVVQPTINTATGEARPAIPLMRVGNRTISGIKAFKNEENFNVTVKPIMADDPRSVRCYVQFSVPKMIETTNYLPADEKATLKGLKQLEKDLRRAGIHANISDAEISRMDACKRVETVEPFQTYTSVLSALQGQRMHKRDYGTTFLWHNTQQEVAVYDKIAEMTHRKNSTAGLPKNVISFEHRLLKARKVQDTLGMKTVKDLLSDFGHVHACYATAMQKQLFKLQVPDVEALSSRALAEQMESIKASGRRFWFQSWLNAYAVAALLDDKTALLDAVGEVAGNKMTVSRLKRQLLKVEADAMTLREVAPSRRSAGELYRELEEKVLAPARALR